MAVKCRVKICGIQSLEEIKIINQFPIHYTGFIFAPSKRQVRQEQVAELRKRLRDDIKSVGVFVNEDMEFVLDTIRCCRLDIVQLHGSESNDYIKHVPVPVWKSIAVKDETSLGVIKSYSFAQGILLDTYHKGKTGGTGKSFNWSLTKYASHKGEIILAGGLDPNNIVQAVTIAKPDIVDINSGVEAQGKKDEKKIASLIEQLKKNRMIS